MSTRTLVMFISIAITLSFQTINIYSQNSSSWQENEKRAIDLFNSGKHEEAIILFRENIAKSDNPNIIREGYFWLAKALMSVSRYDQAGSVLEFYILNYADGLNISEAYYQKGRLLFEIEDYNGAIEQLTLYIDKYPKHGMISNAYYWIGESLYSLGRLDDSAVYFKIVSEKYPRSLKREASLYKLKLVEHKKTEYALQNLLKWSQEQYISSLSKFRAREKTLQQAIEEYSRGGAGSTQSSEEDRKRIEGLLAENSRLQQRILELEKMIRDGSSDKLLESRIKEINNKELILKQKEEALRIIDIELKQKEKKLAK